MPGVPPARYAYLGPEGTFTEAALRSLPAAAKAELLPCSIGDGSRSRRSGRSEADGAVVPIENSVEGGVAATLDELSNGDPLMITREMHVEVQFSLLAKPGTGPEDIKKVATHPHAEAQCRRWLRDAPARRRGRAGVVDGARGGPGRGAGLAVRRGDLGADRRPRPTGSPRWPRRSPTGRAR